MADVKWIKITTDIFDDEKILLIESLPDSYAIITVWFKLLSLAGKQNNSGVFMMGRIAYTDKMLATIFRMKETTVTMALQTFQQFGMIEIVDGVITIPNWGKHQNLDQLESKKQYMRNYMAEYREKQKALTAGKPNCKTNSKANVSQAEEDIEEDKEIEEEIEEEIDNISPGVEPPPEPKINCEEIINLFNTICKSFPQVRKLTDARRQMIRTRLRKYTVDDFKTVFENAQASSFLRGDEGGWKATFDWLIKESSMVKVLEGNYADKPKRGRKEKVPGWCKQFEPGQAEMEAIARLMNEPSPFEKPTVGNSPELADRAEKLRQSLGG